MPQHAFGREAIALLRHYKDPEVVLGQLARDADGGARTDVGVVLDAGFDVDGGGVFAAAAATSVL